MLNVVKRSFYPNNRTVSRLYLFSPSLNRQSSSIPNMSAIKPFQIAIPDKELELLRQKLSLARFPDELDDSGWALGAPLADLKRLHSHWLNRYSWRDQESHINKTLPQFTTEVDVDGFGTINMHFVHKTSSSPNAIPLLFVHGWPGSFLEVEKILPHLVDPKPGAPAFDVVAPSLPGYGFSQGASKKGFGPNQCAQACHKVMQALGYTQYVTQGGDWGSIVTRSIGMFYPQSCRASHLNMWGAKSIPRSQPLVRLQYALTPFTAVEKIGMANRKWFLSEGNAYYKEHATKPQTIGYSQTDSPIGLLGWIYEKLHDWTDDYPWTDDEVITWISMYWFATAGPVGGTRLYYEAQHDKTKMVLKANGWIPDVKLGLAVFPKEIGVAPKTLGHVLGPVVYQSEYDKGGHFAAWERPDAIVKDLQTMFGKGGGAYSVISGRSGYSDQIGARL